MLRKGCVFCYITITFLINELPSNADSSTVQAWSQKDGTIADLISATVYTSTGCYGIDPDRSYISSSCINASGDSSDGVIAVQSVMVSAKQLSDNCQSPVVPGLNDSETCCFKDDTDCRFPLSSSYVRERCSGRYICEGIQVPFENTNAENCDLNHSDYKGTTSLLEMEYFCVKESHLGECTAVSETISNSETFFITSSNYPSNVSTSCSCSIEATSCNYSINMVTLHRTLVNETDCLPSLILRDGDTNQTLTHEDNTNFDTSIQTSSTSYVAFELNSCDEGGVQFWFGFQGSDAVVELSINCPAIPNQEMCEWADPTTTTTTTTTPTVPTTTTTTHTTTTRTTTTTTTPIIKTTTPISTTITPTTTTSTTTRPTTTSTIPTTTSTATTTTTTTSTTTLPSSTSTTPTTAMPIITTTTTTTITTTSATTTPISNTNASNGNTETNGLSDAVIITICVIAGLVPIVCIIVIGCLVHYSKCCYKKYRIDPERNDPVNETPESKNPTPSGAAYPNVQSDTTVTKPSWPPTTTGPAMPSNTSFSPIIVRGILSEDISSINTNKKGKLEPIIPGNTSKHHKKHKSRKHKSRSKERNINENANIPVVISVMPKKSVDEVNEQTGQAQLDSERVYINDNNITKAIIFNKDNNGSNESNADEVNKTIESKYSDNESNIGSLTNTTYPTYESRTYSLPSEESTEYSDEIEYTDIENDGDTTNTDTEEEDTFNKSASPSGIKIKRYKRSLKKKHKHKSQPHKTENRHTKAGPDFESLLRTVNTSFFEPRSLDQHLHKVVRLAKIKPKEKST